MYAGRVTNLIQVSDVQWLDFAGQSQMLQLVKRWHYCGLFDTASMPPELSECRPHITLGDTVLDLGANLGIYSKFLSQLVGPGGQVHAVELMPETFCYLRHNVSALANVRCYHAGISNRTGIGCAIQPSRKYGHIYRAHLAEKGQPAPVYRLDDLFPELSPTFIKCDVEGAELQVIEGAENLIGRCFPIWLMETYTPETFETMKNLGYCAQKLSCDWLFSHPLRQLVRDAVPTQRSD